MSISHKRLAIIKGGRNRKKRPKTFKTEEAAKTYAERLDLKDYSVKNLRSDSSKTKKLRVVY